MTRQAVRRVANDLLGDGLVELDANPDHRTSPLLSLTDRGRTALARINKLAAVENNRLVRAVGADVVRNTHQGVRLLAAALKG